MEKITLYPKTGRIKNNLDVRITEKIDGSNIGFFKVNGKILIAQRNNIFFEDEIEKQSAYKGLIGWLEKYGNDLREHLIEGSGFFGEWIGMGKISYPEITEHVLMFAKANIEDNKVKNIYYDSDLFIYPFENQKIPDYIGVVPEVCKLEFYPHVEDLNEIYKSYSEEKEYEFGRKVEGFIVINNNEVKKYVRMKNGILQEPYYFINSMLEVEVDIEEHNRVDDQRYAIGNYFETKEEAEFKRDKMKNYIRLKKLIREI